jgi:aryl-alcohol dehydrogenase-like predicted oxidoreductase
VASDHPAPYPHLTAHANDHWYCKYGMSLTELSLRWCKEREALTSVLLGVSSMEQLEEDLAYFQNPEPLPAKLMWAIDW